MSDCHRACGFGAFQNFLPYSLLSPFFSAENVCMRLRAFSFCRRVFAFFDIHQLVSCAQRLRLYGVGLSWKDSVSCRLRFCRCQAKPHVASLTQRVPIDDHRRARDILGFIRVSLFSAILSHSYCYHWANNVQWRAYPCERSAFVRYAEDYPSVFLSAQCARDPGCQQRGYVRCEVFPIFLLTYLPFFHPSPRSAKSHVAFPLPCAFSFQAKSGLLHGIGT